MKFSCRFSLAGAYDEEPARPIGIGLVGAENVRRGAGNIRLPSSQEVTGGPAPKARKIRKPDRRGRPVETLRQHGRTANKHSETRSQERQEEPMMAHAMRRKGALLQRFFIITCWLAALVQGSAALSIDAFPPVPGGGFHTSMQSIHVLLS
ncbi:hypothetical protein [Herbaspirillum seropedicae]|uniref:hypothetical protein n=1 Tax=Herbaspirillum seropedicae TaxID=964 RepID=UPI001E324734|nr:hypothetical protein [Herbaspirillum seropedicae]